MAVWDHRQIGRGVYVVRRDGVEVVHVSMSGIARESLTASAIAEACARSNDDALERSESVCGRPGCIRGSFHAVPAGCVVV